MWVQNFSTLLALSLLAFAASYPYRDHLPKDNVRFQQSIEKAMDDVKQILNTTRYPVIAFDDKDHTYDDKYSMVEMVTNSMLGSIKNVLGQLGVPFDTVLQWVHHDKRSVSLRFVINKKCRYVKETKSSHKSFFSETGIIYKHHFEVTSPYRLELRKGMDGETIVLKERDMSREIALSGQHGVVPRAPLANVSKSIDLDITWIAQQFELRSNGSSKFSIDRRSSACKTPKRNPEITQANEVFVGKLAHWCKQLAPLLLSREETSITFEGEEHVDQYTDMIFRPVIPFFENHTALDNETVKTFLKKHESSLKETMAAVSKFYQEDDYISDSEVHIALLSTELGLLVNNWFGSVRMVEEMLHSQLRNAIGKSLNAKDFQEFLESYGRYIFNEQVVPKPFAYAIRRGKNYPDGMLSLEGNNNRNNPWAERQFMQTTVRHIPGKVHPPISIPLNPASSIEIEGDRYLHGWLQTQWEQDSTAHNYNFLAARAHQFSSLLLIVGQMSGSDTFIPKEAIVLQNKDEVLIPIITSVLPSAKEFNDSIMSLSPEQQEFAKAFREIQLGSSVLGVCVIQIKPQLERLLNIPDGSLTKEIRLTQDLMSLFADYQIPSDMLTYDGPPEAKVSEKIDSVKQYVKAVTNVIDDLKDKQLKEVKKLRFMTSEIDEDVDLAEDFHESDIALDKGPSGKSMLSDIALDKGPSGFGRSMVRTKQKLKRAETRGLDVQKKHISSADSENQESYKETERASGTVSKAKPTSGTNSEDWGQYKEDKKIYTKDETRSLDFSLIPKILDARIEKEDEDGALKSTIIKPGSNFWRSRQENLLMAPTKSHLASSIVQDEKNQAMDLLTAISRSGSLPIESSELHILIGMTHCFPKQIMETVIEDNINPIRKVEESLLLIASVIHDKPDKKDLLSKAKFDALSIEESITDKNGIEENSKIE